MVIYNGGTVYVIGCKEKTEVDGVLVWKLIAQVSSERPYAYLSKDRSVMMTIMMPNHYDCDYCENGCGQDDGDDSDGDGGGDDADAEDADDGTWIENDGDNVSRFLHE